MHGTTRNMPILLAFRLSLLLAAAGAIAIPAPRAAGVTPEQLRPRPQPHLKIAPAVRQPLRASDDLIFAGAAGARFDSLEIYSELLLDDSLPAWLSEDDGPAIWRGDEYDSLKVIGAPALR